MCEGNVAAVKEGCDLVKEREYTPCFTDIMPEILEESRQVESCGGALGLGRPLLCVIGSARAISFPMHLQVSCLPQLPLAGEIRRKGVLRERRRCEEIQNRI